MDPLDPTNTNLPTGNGSAAGTAVESTPPPSVEALLFNSGAISADQLGELVRDAVLTQRSVAAIALERGLATTEMLAALQARAGLDMSVPGPFGGANASPHAEIVSTEATFAPPTPLPESADIFVSPLDTGTVMPASDPAEVVVESEPTTTPPRLEPVESLEERVRAAVARAAQTPPSPPAPVVPTLGAQMAAPPDDQPTVTAAAFAVLVRLQTGERLAAGTTGTVESAVKIARSLAEQLAGAGEWPLIAGRCIRPDIVVSVDVEQTLDG